MGAPQTPKSVATQRKIATGEHYNLYFCFTMLITDYFHLRYTCKWT